MKNHIWMAAAVIIVVVLLTRRGGSVFVSDQAAINAGYGPQ